MDLLELFCTVDDFCKKFEPSWKKQLINDEKRKRNRASQLSLNEIITILIHFHQSAYRDFKDYYCRNVQIHLINEFPGLVSYNRFVELTPSCLVPFGYFLMSRRGKVTGISFVDSTILKVCHNLRIHSNRVFKDFAKRGKTSTGWFYGFKLHLIINECGEFLSFHISQGNVDDRKPLPKMCKGIWGKLFGDKGYISQFLEELFKQDGLQLITKMKKNMKKREMTKFDKILLRKRAIIETVNDQLKSISQIEHTRHRSVKNFLVNIIAGLVAYSFQTKKPSLNIQRNELNFVAIE